MAGLSGLPYTPDFKIALLEIDNGRFEDMIHALNVVKECEQCGFFNPAKSEIYRCYCIGSCIAATLHPNLQSYLRWKLGWQDEAAHLATIGLITKQAEKCDPSSGE